VIVVPIAVASTSITQWDTGNLGGRICLAIQRLKLRGIVPGTNVTFAIDWGQGESDEQLGTSQAAYTTALNHIISTAAACGFSGRWFVAIETWEAGTTSAGVQAAQAAVVNNTTVFAGANADSIGSGSRQSDNIHFNDSGAASLATLKKNAMHASGAPF
jgi:Carbohydrate esterase, sialic acid-specific acetylesterase